jgi:hypothetical protein
VSMGNNRISMSGIETMADNTERQPLIRALRAGSWGLSCGEARYYGWRLFVQIGRLVILAGRAPPEAAHNGEPTP